MSHTLVCWKCGNSLAALTLPFRRLEECKKCGAELHVCRMCLDYDTTVAKKCREPIAEEVFDKERANFCDHYQPRPNAFIPKDETAANQSKSALDALFGGSTASGTTSTADGARSKLDDLFKK